MSTIHVLPVRGPGTSRLAGAAPGRRPCRPARRRRSSGDQRKAPLTMQRIWQLENQAEAEAVAEAVARLHARRERRRQRVVRVLRWFTGGRGTAGRAGV